MQRHVVVLFWGLCLLLTYNCETENSTYNIPTPLMGSWEMEGIQWRSSDTTITIKDVQPGILLVTSSKYSLMWTPIDGPRVSFERLSAPSDSEIKSGFASVIFNAGTYKATDSTFSTVAQIAKVPGFEGGHQFYRYRLKNDRLWLTMYDETYPNGSKPEWSGKWETNFLLKRITKNQSSL